MRFFLKSLDKRVWKAIINGWKLPTVIIGEVTIPKDVSEWDRVNYENFEWNSKAINVIFNRVTIEEFRRILHSELAKKTWDIL